VPNSGSARRRPRSKQGDWVSIRIDLFWTSPPKVLRCDLLRGMGAPNTTMNPSAKKLVHDPLVLVDDVDIKSNSGFR
jgi:hypothetical protein